MMWPTLIPPANPVIFYYSAELYSMIQFVLNWKGHKIQTLIFPESILAENVGKTKNTLVSGEKTKAS